MRFITEERDLLGKEKYDMLRQISNDDFIAYLEENDWLCKSSNLLSPNLIRYHHDGTFRTVMIPNEKTVDWEHRWDFNIESLAMVNDISKEEVIKELVEWTMNQPQPTTTIS